ncbi:MAG: MFS transporter [Casimicrobiaceae bacterium]|nr:MFS transporter [Casimicrobiaceae bacterium]MCX8097449.1 MFS transporter [Casimicrobiaceae bacterium]MDW8311167.1 MFS transporter [Burkholderiales bacterium]
MSGASTSPKPTGSSGALRRERALLLTLLAMGCTSIVDFMIVMPLAAPLMRAWGLSSAQFGLLVSAYAFAATLSSAALVAVADRYDRRSLMLAIYLGQALGLAASAAAPDYLALLAARFTCGFFGGMHGSVAQAMIGDVVPDERRGRATAFVLMAFAFASVLGVPLGILAAALGGWRTPFIVLTALALAVALAAWRYLPSLTNHLAAGRTSGLAQSYLEVLRDPNHRWALALSALTALAGMLVIPFVAPTRTANEGMSEQALALFYLVGGLATLLTRPAVGVLCDRYRRAHVFFVLTLGALPSIVLVTHPLGGELALQLPLAACFFLFVSGRFIPMTTMLTAATQPALRGRLMALASAVMNLATAGAAALAGALMTTTAEGRLLGYERVGWLACALAAASVVVAYRVRSVS